MEIYLNGLDIISIVVLGVASAKTSAAHFASSKQPSPLLPKPILSSVWI